MRLNTFRIQILLFSLFVFSTLRAEEPKFKFCVEETEMNCHGIEGTEKVFACLKRNENQLSSECRLEILELQQAFAPKMEIMNPSQKKLAGLRSEAAPFPVLTYEGSYANANPYLIEQKLNYSTPLYQTPKDYLAFSIASGGINFGKPVLFSSAIESPDKFYRSELGLQYKHQLGDYRNWGLKGTYGFSSDQAFGDENSSDAIYSLNIQYGFPTGKQTYWQVFLYYSNSGLFENIPLPGILYMYRTETFTALVGFPILSLNWKPDNNRSYKISMSGTSINTEAAYGDLQDAQLFVALSWNTQKYMTEKKQTKKDRIYIEEKKLALGIRSFIFGLMQVEARAGYAFDRQVYMGEGFRDMSRGIAFIDSDWFVSTLVKTTF